MKCVSRKEGKDILEEIHMGVCGNHASSRMLVSKAFVPRVPVLRQVTACPGLQASHYTTNLAFHLLGDRHDWASSDCSKRVQQSSGVHR
jgi:hypothetical protein